MTGFCGLKPHSSSKSHRSAMARWADAPLSAPPTLCAAVQTEAGDREHLERAAPRQRSAGVQVGLSAFWKPVHAWPPSHVALWTAPSSDALSTGEWRRIAESVRLGLRAPQHPAPHDLSDPGGSASLASGSALAAGWATSALAIQLPCLRLDLLSSRPARLQKRKNALPQRVAPKTGLTRRPSAPCRFWQACLKIAAPTSSCCWAALALCTC